MTSTEFIREVAAANDMTIKDVKMFADMFDVAIKEKLVRGEKFKFADINFDVRDVEARECRNPKTGEVMSVDATRKVVVRPASNLKALVK